MIKLILSFVVSILWVLAYQHMPQFTGMIFAGWMLSIIVIYKAD